MICRQDTCLTAKRRECSTSDAKYALVRVDANEVAVALFAVSELAIAIQAAAAVLAGSMQQRLGAGSDRGYDLSQGHTYVGGIPAASPLQHTWSQWLFSTSNFATRSCIGTNTRIYGSDRAGASQCSRACSSCTL